MEIDCVEFNLFEPQAMFSPKNPLLVLQTNLRSQSPMEMYTQIVAENA